MHFKAFLVACALPLGGENTRLQSEVTSLSFTSKTGSSDAISVLLHDFFFPDFQLLLETEEDPAVRLQAWVMSGFVKHSELVVIRSVIVPLVSGACMHKRI